MILKKTFLQISILLIRNFFENIRLIKYGFNFKFNFRLPLIFRFFLISANFLIISRSDEFYRDFSSRESDDSNDSFYSSSDYFSNTFSSRSFSSYSYLSSSYNNNDVTLQLFEEDPYENLDNDHF